MWEHVAPFIGIPSAIKSTLDLLDRIKSNPQQPQASLHQATTTLNEVNRALESFAVDALELVAFKSLHTLTNSLAIDLRQTFVLDNPDRAWAQKHHADNVHFIETEWLTIWEGERAGSQLIRLSERGPLMRYLEAMPSEILERVRHISWEICFRTMLRETQSNIENFAIFYTKVRELRGLNAALNNYANRSIERGIEEFDTMMQHVRLAISKSAE
jgi:hypothetical protein